MSSAAATSLLVPAAARTVSTMLGDPTFDPGVPADLKAAARAAGAFQAVAHDLPVGSPVGSLVRTRVWADPVQELVDQIVGELTNGKLVGDELVERAAAAARDREAIRTAADVLDRARDRVDREFIHQVVIHADDLVAGPLRAEHDAVVGAFTGLRSASGGRDFADPAAFVGAPAAAQEAFTSVRGLVPRMNRVRTLQRALFDVGEIAGLGPALPWAIGGWDLPWHLHVPEVSGWAVGRAGSWWSNVDERTGRFDDDWPLEPWPRFLRTMARGSVCLTPTEVIDRFGQEYDARHPSQLVTGR